MICGEFAREGYEAMATQETVDAITTLVAEITKRDVDDVVKDSKWGTYNFEDCRDNLKAAYAVILPLQELPLTPLLDETAVGFVTQLSTLQNAIDNVTGFTIEQDNAGQNKNDLAAALNTQTQGTWQMIAPWIGYLFFQAGDVSENLKKFRETQGQMEDALVKFLAKADEGQKQIGSAVAATKEVSAKAGVGHFTEDFAGASTEHGDDAENWLKAAAVFVVVTACAAWAFWYGFDAADYKDTASLIQLILFKGIVLGLLFTGTIWCARMYKTNKHQQTVNKHRANALKTFQAFVQATNDPAVRDAVLMETTRSIFAITPSGYLGESDSGSNAGSKVVEIIRAASKEATKDGE